MNIHSNFSAHLLKDHEASFFSLSPNEADNKRGQNRGPENADEATARESSSRRPSSRSRSCKSNLGSGRSAAAPASRRRRSRYAAGARNETSESQVTRGRRVTDGGLLPFAPRPHLFGPQLGPRCFPDRHNGSRKLLLGRRLSFPETPGDADSAGGESARISAEDG
ncbi:hypothetical protein HPB48_012705 [Haemaphysalis longicornis]|uniref:Uncharacterized protein n=1 Tax=Haemaphysalis longicornis TaxID=44386 RepID=A0A9J6FZ57_HAELO|nr:hypothetical protein HPB48_012705 [Haemaphysalis longicornis]